MKNLLLPFLFFLCSRCLGQIRPDNRGTGDFLHQYDVNQVLNKPLPASSTFMRWRLHFNCGQVGDTCGYLRLTKDFYSPGKAWRYGHRLVKKGIAAGFWIIDLEKYPE